MQDSGTFKSLKVAKTPFQSLSNTKMALWGMVLTKNFSLKVLKQ